MTVKNISASIIKVMDSGQFADKRQAHKVVYPLIPTLLVICLACIAGKNNAVAAADYWKYNLERLRSLVPGLPAESISHDTVLRLMKIMRFDEFNSFILQLTQSIIQATQERKKSIVALDGQTPSAIKYTQHPTQRHPQDKRTYDHLYFVTA